MWLCVLHPGPARWLSVCCAFLFHQGTAWMINIRFHEFSDMYIVWVPWAALLALIRGRTDGSATDDHSEHCTAMLVDEGGHAVADAALDKARSVEVGRSRRCSALASSSGKRSQLLVVIFCIVWGTLRLRPGTPEHGAYPLVRFPEFCRAHTDTSKKWEQNVLREVRLLAASANKSGEFALLARVPLYDKVGGTSKGTCSVAPARNDVFNVCGDNTVKQAVGNLLRELPSFPRFGKLDGSHTCAIRHLHSSSCDLPSIAIRLCAPSSTAARMCAVSFWSISISTSSTTLGHPCRHTPPALRATVGSFFLQRQTRMPGCVHARARKQRTRPPVWLRNGQIRRNRQVPR